MASDVRVVLDPVLVRERSFDGSRRSATVKNEAAMSLAVPAVMVIVPPESAVVTGARKRAVLMSVRKLVESASVVYVLPAESATEGLNVPPSADTATKTVWPAGTVTLLMVRVVVGPLLFAVPAGAPPPLAPTATGVQALTVCDMAEEVLLLKVVLPP